MVAITIAAAMTSGCPVALSDDFVVAGDGGEQLATGGSTNDCGATKPAGAPCPEEVCNGGCLVGGICVISCTTDKPCQGLHKCPPGFACSVNCDGDQSCPNLALACPSDQSCDISCTGVDACKDAHVACATGEACRATCELGTAKPALDNCGKACDCQRCL